MNTMIKQDKNIKITITYDNQPYIEAILAYAYKLKKTINSKIIECHKTTFRRKCKKIGQHN